MEYETHKIKKFEIEREIKHQAWTTWHQSPG